MKADEVLAQIAEKYKIPFFLDDGITWRPINEWLDDVYLRLSKKEMVSLMMDIMNHGDEIFKDLIEHLK